MGRQSHGDSGFTVVEVLAVSLIVIALLSLSAAAVRHYWRVRSLQGAQAEVISQLRQAQQRSASEGIPSSTGRASARGARPALRVLGG